MTALYPPADECMLLLSRSFFHLSSGITQHFTVCVQYVLSIIWSAMNCSVAHVIYIS